MSLPERKSLRLEGYDYSEAGYYFVTACAKGRRCIFSSVGCGFPDVSQVEEGRCMLPSVGRGILDAPQVKLTEYGKQIEETLSFLDAHSEHIRVDKYIIMPNHIHLILQLSEGGASGKPRPTEALIPKFMSSLKRYTNRKTGLDLWQTSYYDHIIRNQPDYLRIWQYIDTNPAKWEEDEYYIP